MDIWKGIWPLTLEKYVTKMKMRVMVLVIVIYFAFVSARCNLMQNIGSAVTLQYLFRT